MDWVYYTLTAGLNGAKRLEWDAEHGMIDVDALAGDVPEGMEGKQIPAFWLTAE